MTGILGSERSAKKGVVPYLLHDHRHVLRSRERRCERPRRWIGATRGGLNSKLRAVRDDRDRPLVMLLSEGQMSDYRAAAMMIGAVPRAKVMLGDRGYDADRFRAALADRKITTRIPSKVNRTAPIPHDAALSRQRHKIEIMFGRLKGRRRIHGRYDRCVHTFMSALCTAATVIFWINR